MSGKREFHMDLNLTNQCNLRCSYCVEAGLFTSKTCEEMLPRFYAWIDRFIGSQYFKERYDELHIALWGGEPTLEWRTIIELVRRYLGDNRVAFFLYTNGYNHPKGLQDLLVDATNKHREQPDKYPAFPIQISYDGMPLQDMFRKTVGGKPSSERVIETIRWAQAKGLDFSLKATITVASLKHLYAAWHDINILGRGELTYFPTLDYYNAVISDDTAVLDTSIEEMKTCMKMIAADTLRARAAGKQVAHFRWFDSAKASCSAGQNLFSVDLDGVVYACHTAPYSEKKADHVVGALEDDFSIFDVSAEKHRGLRPHQCSGCEAVFCVVCSVSKYRMSDKDNYLDRWMDYTNDDESCRIYREMGKVTRAFLQLKEEIK
jgi:radical SAM protein with 4Fe4S-binding SPASM domain